MSEVKVNKISPRAACGTVTLGDSGDTIALGSGATQTGFGRTGTVDWQTGDIKTSTFTAVNGQGFFVDTNGGAVISNLPAGSAGAIVSFQDYRNTFDTAALTIQPNGSEKINGGVGAIILNTEGEGITLVYIDGTIGWRSIQDNVFPDTGSNYVAATGGTVTTFGDFKIHKFTGPGSFCVSAGGSPTGSNTVDYLIVAGGGGGGTSGGGGGGAGGFRLLSCQSISATAFPVTVGSGGTKGCCSPGGAGSTTTFKCNSSAGGGGGASYDGTGVAGGSGGGGGSGGASPGTYPGGAGNTPATPVSQGNAGGSGTGSPQPQGRGGGGGGAAAVGSNQVSAGLGGPGGNGTDVSPTFGPGFGDSNFFSGGAGGGAQSNPGYSAGAPTGGNGGGGTGGGAAAPYGGGCGSAGSNGTDNTGGGGGGSGNGGGSSPVAGIGGSGIVLIKYKFQN